MVMTMIGVSPRTLGEPALLVSDQRADAAPLGEQNHAGPADGPVHHCLLTVDLHRWRDVIGVAAHPLGDLDRHSGLAVDGGILGLLRAAGEDRRHDQEAGGEPEGFPAGSGA